MAFLIKRKEEILSDALRKLTTATGISSVSPGSVARAIAESITDEIGDLYSVLDFNMSLNVLSSAQGRTLDLIGSLFNVQRKTLSDLAATDKMVGAFYFYIDTPYSANIVIPIGTQIFTNTTDRVGRNYTYSTSEEVIIPAGRLRVYASIRPQFNDAIFTAGPNTLTVIDPNFTQPIGITVRCINPKAIDAQLVLEDDTNYRTRIQKAVRVAAGGTMNAVRFSGLAINGVRDITMRETPYGLGSFEAIVVTEDNLISGPVLLAASRAMNAVRPVGVRLFVRQPDFLPVVISASIVLRPNVFISDTSNITRRVQTGILRYLNKMLVGTPLIYNELVQATLDSTDVVQDVVFTQLSINGVEVLRKNYTPDSDQQLIPGNINVTIATS